RVPAIKTHATSSAFQHHLCIKEKSLETKVHVLLNVTVKKRQPRLIGGEIHSRASIVRHDYCVFDDSRDRRPIDIRDFKQMPMKMQGVSIIGAVVQDQSVANPFLQHEFFFMRVWLSVHKEAVEFAGSARNFFKDHIDSLLRSR